MQRRTLRFGKGFKVAFGNARGEAATMVIAPGDAEGDAGNRHRGADQWLYVVSGRGFARVNGRRHALAERTLGDLVRSQEARRVRIEDILRIVSRHYKVPRNDLLSSRRSRDVVRPRQIAMYLAKALTSRSLPEIGRRFGGRDHTTVLHSVRKVEQMMKDDTELTQEIELLKKMLEDFPPA